VPQPARPLVGKRVLVVDDHADTLEVLGLVLTHVGADVLVSASLENALSVLSTTPVDAVITDLGFGGDSMAGTRILDGARIHRDGCPVIAVTGLEEVEDDLRAVGFDAVLIKPVDPFALAEVVARMVR
jgi:CheY-like chemotaxis protein